MRYSIFLPFAQQDSPPLDLLRICDGIERSLDTASSPDVERHTAPNGLLGIMIGSSAVASEAALWGAVMPILPPGVFGGQRS
jgi:hypothetical protein